MEAPAGEPSGVGSPSPGAGWEVGKEEGQVRDAEQGGSVVGAAEEGEGGGEGVEGEAGRGGVRGRGVGWQR